MARGTVLIIDDDRGTRDGLQFAFIRRGWEAVVTETELEALAVLTGYEPDWVIASWDQLGGTGSRFVRAVRGMGRRVRLALLTEPGSLAARSVAGLKADRVFSKPINADDLYRACDLGATRDPAVGVVAIKSKPAGSPAAPSASR